jgi:hypothetical protein
MPNYKSLSDAMKDLKIPLRRVGNEVVKSIKNMINSNSVPGEPLKTETIRKKTQNHQVKLLHLGYLRDGTVYSTEKNKVSIGYQDRLNNHREMTDSGLAETHNEGKGRVPRRPFLFDNGQWNDTHRKAIEKFIEKTYKSKGII